MTHCDLAVEPFSVPLDGASISANVSKDVIWNSWNVTIVLARAPDQAAIEGEEIDSRLIDDQGVEFSVLERPSGFLVEASSSLSSSTNALFRFHNSSRVPAEIVVLYQGREVYFRIVPNKIKPGSVVTV